MTKTIYRAALLLLLIALPLAIFGDVVIKTIGAAVILLALAVIVIVVMRERLSR